MSASQAACMASLGPAIEQCSTMCSNITKKLEKITLGNSPNKLDWVDRIRLQFNENNLMLLKAALERHKQTLDIALGMVTFQTLSRSDAARIAFETKVANSVSGVTGQLEGLRLAMGSLAIANVNITKQNVANVLTVLNEQDIMLRQCLKFCTISLDQTTKLTGTNVKHAIALDKAQVFVGNMGVDANAVLGGPAVNLGTLEARNDARAGAGTMSPDVAKVFWSSSNSS